MAPEKWMFFFFFIFLAFHFGGFKVACLKMAVIWGLFQGGLDECKPDNSV